jgi:hypothetical protein
MIVSSLLAKSFDHEICEDALFYKKTPQTIRGGVFDGCSSGLDSVWASNTLKHLFESYDFFYYLSDQSIIEAIRKFKTIKDILKLEIPHLEATAILFEYFVEEKVLYIRAFGDCFYFVNGVKYEIDEDNEPDYMGHYVDCDFEDLKEYMKAHPVTRYDNVENFSVCSDGIAKIGISPLIAKDKEMKKDSNILFENVESENHLDRRWNMLKKDGWIVKDDLSIISVNNGSTPI